MEKCQQGVSVRVRSTGQVFMMAQSRASNGLLGGNGKFRKLQITDSDAVLGMALRACINDRKPGFCTPHMYKEKEAHQAMMKEYLEDRGIVSDKVFYKGTKGFSVREFPDRIEFFASGPDALIKGGPHVVVPHNASDTELAQAMRRTLELCLA